MDVDEDGIMDSTAARAMFSAAGIPFTTAVRDSLIAADTLYDTLIEAADQWASRKLEQFSIVGGDAGMPLVDSRVLRFDLYGQAATRLDKVSGWGFGAPGVLLTFNLPFIDTSVDTPAEAAISIIPAAITGSGSLVCRASRITAI
jgi:hypothetical protein